MISIAAWIVLFVGHQRAVRDDPLILAGPSSSKIHQLKGTIESVYRTRHGITILRLADAGLSRDDRDVVIMPNLGLVRPEPRPYDVVHITAVKGYRGRWEPVSARHVVVAGSAFDSEEIPTVTISQADQMPEGSIVRLVAMGVAGPCLEAGAAGRICDSKFRTPPGKHLVSCGRGTTKRVISTCFDRTFPSR